MNIDEMEAGREMDAMVAEKVMGWERGAVCWMIPNNTPGERIGPLIDEWQPSTDIAAAWEAVEKCLLLGYGLNIRKAFYDEEEDRWYIAVTINLKNKSSSVARFTVFDETAPLAICRAALKAVEK